MAEIITVLVLGVVLVGLGILNFNGNLSTLHSYHRKRVKKEDIKPFGRLVGIGTITIGAGFIFSAILHLIGYVTKNLAFNYVGYAVLGVGFVVGLIFSFYAMIKYNKGIF